MRPPTSVPKPYPGRRHDRREAATPFERGTDERSLRVVFDHRTIQHDRTTRELAGFGHHSLIEAVEIGGSGAIPRLTLGAPDSVTDSILVTEHRVSGSSRFVSLGQTQLGEFAQDFVTEGLGTDPVEMERELRVAGVARAWGADALVTDSEFLLRIAPRPMAGPANPMTPEQAFALFGLYLRSRDDFTISKDAGFCYQLQRQTYDWALARALLPSGWRFINSCAAADPELEGPLPFLSLAVPERVAHALRARERVLIHAYAGGGYGPASEQLFYFDHAVLALGGAFDAVAGVADHVYQLGSKPQAIGWRRDWFNKRLAPAAPELAALMQPDRSPGSVLDTVALLRNTIHGAPLLGIRFAEGPGVRNQEDLVKIPRGRATGLLDAIERLGGQQRWGIKPIHDDFVFFRASTFIDALITEACSALNQIMSSTDVGRLANVKGGIIRDDPRKSRNTDEFSPESQRALRLLAGI